MKMEQLVALLAEHLDVDPALIQPETTFESLGIDSLDTVEMVMELEEHLGVELELDEKVSTVGELMAFVEKKLG
ncbi:MAG: acyl carrier protein [Oscillospiraceae bacterium]|nr:acyl carrier protein [Oscillospiraceae bacterium]